MLIPNTVRELAYRHVRTYDATNYDDYMLRITSKKVISFCNKDDVIKIYKFFR